MPANLYRFIDNIVDNENDVWIQGDSETGKTTLIKYLFDCDTSHPYKWMIGGCSPVRSSEYYNQLIEDILRIKYSPHSSMSIYVDEAENQNVLRLVDIRRKLNVTTRLIIVSHHLPPIKITGQFNVYQMADILSVELLGNYIKENCSFPFPTDYYFSVSDYFCIIDNIQFLKTESDLNILHEKNAENSKKRKEEKATVDHNIWILRTPDYERVNLLRFKNFGNMSRVL